MSSSPRNNAPELPAYPRSDDGCLKVWCKYCEVWHLHGRGYGHRGAHCGAMQRFTKDGRRSERGSVFRSPDSPYMATGYVLVAPVL
jgi:hypothetical protein